MKALDEGPAGPGGRRGIRGQRVCTGRRRQQHRHDSGPRSGRTGRGAAGRDGDGDQPVALGAQTTVTSETGNYRFPAVPPGTYELTFELAGFNTLKRSGISITLGFTAQVNVELALATLQETVTVSGASPVIDTTTTRVQQNFKMEQLQSIPNGRDMWALLAVTPAVQMNRIDVGGNRAGTQTGYTAYGQTGQVRVLIEGINTTEGTGGAGFYFDYASLEEAFLGTIGPVGGNAEPRRAVAVHRALGLATVPGRVSPRLVQQLAPGLEPAGRVHGADGVQQLSPIRAHSNEIDRYYDHDINAGGPIKKDKVWFFGTYRKQFNAVAQPNFQFDKTFDTSCGTRSARRPTRSTRRTS